MRTTARSLVGIGAALLLLVPSIALGQAEYVRWDIINLAFTAPPTASEGGIAFAKAPDGTKIRFTGAGTFVSPAGRRGGSGAATGGGAWQTFSATDVPIANGTYVVTELVTFEFANFQTPGSLNDLIGNQAQAANGIAVLRIEYSDGSQGVLLVLCHGPGAPAGISEGVAATKGFKTYDQVQAPAPGVNTNRTIFHVLR